MPITINGLGTIAGLSAGGLPDGCITTDDLAAGAVTDAKVNASAAIADSKLSGTTCRAWVNFNGTGTVAIRASYNVSSITDNGVGDYTVNFTTALADANYAIAGNAGGTSGGGVTISDYSHGTARSSSSARMACVSSGGALSDSAQVAVSIFR